MKVFRGGLLPHPSPELCLCPLVEELPHSYHLPLLHPPPSDAKLTVDVHGAHLPKITKDGHCHQQRAHSGDQPRYDIAASRPCNLGDGKQRLQYILGQLAA